MSRNGIRHNKLLCLTPQDPPTGPTRCRAKCVRGQLRNDGEPQGAEVRIKRERRHVIKERSYDYK